MTTSSYRSSAFLASFTIPLILSPSTAIGETPGNFFALKRLYLSQKNYLNPVQPNMRPTFISRKYLFGAFIPSCSVGSHVSRFRGGCATADGRCIYCTKAHQTSVVCKAAKTAHDRRGRQSCDGWALLSTMRERKLGDPKVAFILHDYGKLKMDSMPLDSDILSVI
jgi:hypothetical protein